MASICLGLNVLSSASTEISPCVECLNGSPHFSPTVKDITIVTNG